MASVPPAETPPPSGEPADPGSTPPEISPPGTDTDIPDPMPAGDPGTGSPAEM